MIDARQRRTGFLVAGCFFMEIMDGTIVSTSAPRIGRALGVTSAAVGLVVTAYLVTVAVLIPLSGWLVGRLGTRKVFLTAIVVFTSASVLCSTSSNLALWKARPRRVPTTIPASTRPPTTSSRLFRMAAMATPRTGNTPLSSRAATADHPAERSAL